MTKLHRGLASGLIGLALVSASALPAFGLSLAQHRQAILASQGSVQTLRSAIADFPAEVRALVDLANQAGGSFALVLKSNGRYKLIRIPASSAHLSAANAPDTGAALAKSAPKGAAMGSGTGMSLGVVGGLAGLAAGAAALGASMGGGGSSSSSSGTGPSQPIEPVTSEPSTPIQTSQEYDNLDFGLSHADTRFEVSAGASRLGAGSPDRVHPYTRIGAYQAYDQGYTGQGSKIAVLDGGFSLLYHELVDKELTLSAVAEPWRMTGASADHGTQVAAIAAGSKDDLGMHGIAYDAELHLAQYTVPVSDYDRLVHEFTAVGVDVWNNSWTYQVQPFVSAVEVKQNHNVEIGEMQRYAYELGDAATAMAEVLGSSAQDWSNFVSAIEAFQHNGGGKGQDGQSLGGVVVWANTNYGQSLYEAGYDIDPLQDAALISALPNLFPELQGAWITAVNATDTQTAKVFLGAQAAHVSDQSADGTITLVSARCGMAAAYCLAADGVQVASATATDKSDYQNATGTSLAAPMITGSVAVLRQAFPNLSAQDLTTRLFVTADNSVTGDQDGTAVFTTENGQTYSHGYSYEFGHGFLDLQAALAPIGGTVASATSGGPQFSLEQGASQIGLATAFGSGLQDKLSQASFIASDDMGAGFRLNLAAFTRDEANVYVTDQLDAWLAGSNQETLGSAEAVQMRFNSDFDPQSPLWEADLLVGFALPDQSSAAFGLGSDANFALAGFSQLDPQHLTASMSQDAEALSYLSFADDTELWAAYTQQIGEDTVSVAVFHNGDAASDYASYGMLASQAGQLSETSSFQFTAGLVMETGGMLGSQTSGAFANDTAATSFVQLAAKHELSPKISLSGHYALGFTQVQSYSDTLLQDYDPLTTSSFSLGLSAQDLLAPNSRLTASLSSPTRVLSGSARLHAMTGYDANQQAAYAVQDLDLAATSRELRFGLGFDQALDQNSHWSAGLVATVNPGHNSQAKTQIGAYLGFKKSF